MLFALVVLSIPMCGGALSPSPQNATVHLMKEFQGQGIIVVRSLGFARKQAFAQEYAEEEAIRAVLFTGFSVAHPALLMKKKVMSNQAKEMEIFFSSKVYKACIQNVKPVGTLRKIKGSRLKKMPFDIKINTNALRQLLRKRGLYRMGF